MQFRFFVLMACCIFFSRLQAQETTTDTIQTDDGIMEKVEIEASYPGGDEAWRKFLQANFKATTPIHNGAPAGRYTVFVQFVVSKNGDIKDIKPLTRYGYGMEEEVVRMIKQTGKWNPALQNQRPVNAYRKQPVAFIIMDDNVEIESERLFTLFTNKLNEIKVDAVMVKPEDITLTIAPGTVKPLGEGRFSIKVTKPGKAMAIVYGKNGKTIATINFEVAEQ